MNPADRVHDIYNAMCQVGETYSGDTYKLAKRIERKFRTREGEVRPIYIAVVGTSRHYGGPEEGGWWYDWSFVEEVRKAWDWKTAMKYVRELREDYPQPRYNRFSMANRGEGDYDFVICDDPSFYECRETKERPTYC